MRLCVCVLMFRIHETPRCAHSIIVAAIQAGFSKRISRKLREWNHDDERQAGKDESLRGQEGNIYKVAERKSERKSQRTVPSGMSERGAEMVASPMNFHMKS